MTDVLVVEHVLLRLTWVEVYVPTMYLKHHQTQHNMK